MKKIVFLFLFLFLFTDGISQNSKNEIRGIVTYSGGNLFNAHVKVKNSNQGVATDKNGAFSIKVNVKDTLVFSFQGMKSMETVIDKNTHHLNIHLSPEIEEIKEVKLKKKIFHTPQELLIEYPKNKRLIKTSRGILDGDRSSFSFRIIDGNELIPVGSDFLYSLQNLVPNMRIDRTIIPGVIVHPRVYLQRNLSFATTSTVIFDVDGHIYEQPPTFIEVSDIDRIAILKGSGAFSRYGSIGVGGVIIINTKSQNWMDQKSLKRTFDNSELVDSIRERLSQQKLYIPILPAYIQHFRMSKSSKNAYKLFKRYKSLYGNSPYYYLNVATYLKTRWVDDQTYLQILDELNSNFPEDIEALKALAYTYENAKLFDKSLTINRQILKLNPVEAQSYLNLANNYAQLENYQLAIKIYHLYKHTELNLDTLQFDKFGADNLIFNQINHAILKLNTKNFPSNPIANIHEFDKDTRIVFEWNNKSAEFDIEYTNNHISEKESDLNKQSNELLFEQKLRGYYSKQFFLNNESRSNWIFKVNYHGNKTPVYIKVTTYFNFDRPNTTSKTMVFNLSEAPQHSHLFTLDVNSMTMW